MVFISVSGRPRNGRRGRNQFSTPVILENSLRGHEKRARLVLEIMGDDGETIATETVADLVKVTKGADDLGLSLSEAKGFLRNYSRRWWRRRWNSGRAKTASWMGDVACAASLFVDIRLKSPRYYLPDLVGGNRPATISPLRKLIPDHIAPELLADVLPGAAATLRRFGSTPCRAPSASSGN